VYGIKLAESLGENNPPLSALKNEIWKEIAVQFQVVIKPGTAYMKRGMIMSTRKVFFGAGLWILLLAFAGCAAVQPKPPTDQGSMDPGSTVTFKGDRISLLGSPISMGSSLPSVALVDAMTMKDVNLSQERGAVLFLSLVPSLDTPVCDVQTHYLGEEGDRLPDSVKRITISRDTPFAQKRFAEEAKLTDIRYLSDYKQGEFGQSTGLLLDGLRLMARAVILVDKHGVIRHIQVVPEITHLPHMEEVFEKAIQLAMED
jgi:thiol peroxidase